MAAPITGCPVHEAFQDIPFHPNISFRGPQSLWVQA
jgi:hypothetical protein